MRLFYKNLLPIVITIILFALIFFVGNSIPQETLRKMIVDFGLFGPFIFIFLLLLTYIIAPLNATPILLAGFFAFGESVVVFSFITAFVASIINFYLSRRWGRVIILKFIGKKNMEKVDRMTKNYGLLSLFLLRVFQGVFQDFISYAFGLTSIRFSSYIVVSTLGMIPGTILWYILSLQVESPISFVIINIILGYALLIIFLAWQAGKRYLRK